MTTTTTVADWIDLGDGTSFCPTLNGFQATRGRRELFIIDRAMTETGAREFLSSTSFNQLFTRATKAPAAIGARTRYYYAR